MKSRCEVGIVRTGPVIGVKHPKNINLSTSKLCCTRTHDEVNKLGVPVVHTAPILVHFSLQFTDDMTKPHPSTEYYIKMVG